jgi:hypothetical protein
MGVLKIWHQWLNLAHAELEKAASDIKNLTHINFALRGLLTFHEQDDHAAKCTKAWRTSRRSTPQLTRFEAMLAFAKSR